MVKLKEIRIIDNDNLSHLIIYEIINISNFIKMDVPYILTWDKHHLVFINSISFITSNFLHCHTLRIIILSLILCVINTYFMRLSTSSTFPFIVVPLLSSIVTLYPINAWITHNNVLYSLFFLFIGMKHFFWSKKNIILC